MKHLNPRQGITTVLRVDADALARFSECETPKSPPGDYNPERARPRPAREECTRVKHLNPRQGITIT